MGYAFQRNPFRLASLIDEGIIADAGANLTTLYDKLDFTVFVILYAGRFGSIGIPNQREVLLSVRLIHVKSLSFSGSC